MSDEVTGEGANGLAEAENDLIQGSKHLIFESSLPDLLPNLLNGIHFRCVWRDEEETDVIGDNQSL